MEHSVEDVAAAAAFAERGRAVVDKMRARTPAVGCTAAEHRLTERRISGRKTAAVAGNSNFESVMHNQAGAFGTAEGN